MNQDPKLPDVMKDPSTCPACGAPLAAGRGGDLCPACLLRAAMGEDEHGFPSIAERLGACIGCYELFEQIG